MWRGFSLQCFSLTHFLVCIQRPLLRFWILPVVLFPLVAILIGMKCLLFGKYMCYTCIHVAGGGLVPLDSSRYNITNSELSKLHSTLTASLRSTLSLDVHHHVEEHMDKVYAVVCCTIQGIHCMRGFIFAGGKGVDRK